MTDTPTAQLLYVDPAELVIGANVRLDPRLDKEFIASVKERGVLEPIIAYRDLGGALVVLRGKRRALAAVEAGLAEVQVVVDAAPGDADRVVDQVVENVQRAGLTPAETVAAYEQLAAFGLSAAQIAKRTGARRTEVTAGLAVAGSEVAKGAVKRWDFLDVGQAAVVAEFDGDKAALTRLVQAAKYGGFDHLAQRMRDERDESAVLAEAAAELKAAGVTVIDRPGPGGKAKRLEDLLAGKKPLTVEAHADCPGHAAYVERDWSAPAGREGDRSARRFKTAPVYVCLDYVKHGHGYRYAGPASAGQVAAGQASEADRDAARDQRRDVIASNKAWASAETVRRAWLREFLQRKTPPKGTALFVADALARCGHALGDAFTYGHQFAHQFLGVEPVPGYEYKGEAIAGLLAGASEARAQMLTLTLILAAYEAAADKSSWRHLDRATARYLRFLESQGYELSDVERRACGEQPAATEGGDS